MERGDRNLRQATAARGNAWQLARARSRASRHRRHGRREFSRALRAALATGAFARGAVAIEPAGLAELALRRAAAAAVDVTLEIVEDAIAARRRAAVTGIACIAL